MSKYWDCSCRICVSNRGFCVFTFVMVGFVVTFHLVFPQPILEMLIYCHFISTVYSNSITYIATITIKDCFGSAFLIQKQYNFGIVENPLLLTTCYCFKLIVIAYKFRWHSYKMKFVDIIMIIKNVVQQIRFTVRKS